MSCARFTVRSPVANHFIRSPCAARNASLFSSPFLNRHVEQEFKEMARFFDGLIEQDPQPRRPQVNHARQAEASLFQVLEHFLDPFARTHESARQVEQFVPRFNVREVEGAYEIRGELPGVDRKDLDIQFTDADTLVISGHAENEYTTAPRQETVQAPTVQAVTEGATSDASDLAVNTPVDDDAKSTYSTGSYQRPSVEDDTDGAVAESSQDAVEKHAASEQQLQQQQQQVQTQQTDNNTVYGSSRRTFSQSFQLPARVKYDAVTSSLKNGVLHIVVPKADKFESRRISVL